MGRASLQTRAVRGRAAEILNSRKDALKGMNPALRTQFDALETEFSSTRDDNLNFYHRIGRICNTVREKPETYGEDALRMLEQALSTQARTLRRAAQFATVYEDRELEFLLGLKHPDTGFQLHWGHVGYLLSLATETERTRYAEEAVAKMLDPPALHKLLKKRRGKKQDHGRTHNVPPTPAAMIEQILRFTKQWNAKHLEVWRSKEHDVLPKISQLPLDDLDNELLENLRELLEEIELMAESSRKDFEQLQRTIEHVDQKLTQKTQAAAVAATTAVSGRPARRVQVGRT